MLNEVQKETVLNSALWAAYGDALGFISELTDRAGIRRRAKIDRLQETVTWSRIVGGRFGATVELPAGSYSDDTQLRLATSRAIRADGKFDVEAFAKIELTVWQAYALGAGRGSKAAAANLCRQDVSWFSNFFARGHASYVNAGGNGAAMRIQPHVWMRRDIGHSKEYLRDVVRNAICTHGHMRGIFGAVFHAICVAHAISKREVPGPDVWHQAIQGFIYAAKVLSEEQDLRTFWLPVWEDHSGERLAAAVGRTMEECWRDLEVIYRHTDRPDENSYAVMVHEVGGLTEAQRGSGTKTAMLAAAAAWMYRDAYPEFPLEVCVNLVSSDTDTIATMAGAIIGAAANRPPKGILKDEGYIAYEADRLYRIGGGEPADTFEYPDLFRWRPPKSHADAVFLLDDRMFVLGLGLARPVSEGKEGRKKEDAVWQWLELEFGQTILVRRRRRPIEVKKEAAAHTGYRARVTMGEGHPETQMLPGFEQPAAVTSERRRRESNVIEKNIDELTREAISSNFNAALIGQHLMSFSDLPDGIEKSIAYVSIVLKAKMSRKKANKSQ